MKLYTYDELRFDHKEHFEMKEEICYKSKKQCDKCPMNDECSGFHTPLYTLEKIEEVYNKLFKLKEVSENEVTALLRVCRDKENPSRETCTTGIKRDTFYEQCNYTRL